MADTPQAPATAPAGVSTSRGIFDDDTSVVAATEAFLGLMDPPPEDTPEAEEEAAPEEVTEESEAEVEASAETDAEESDEPEETDDAEEEGPDLYAVNIDGKEELITLEDLTSSYLRQSDYTKKTQALSEQRKDLDSHQATMAQERQAIQQERAQYANALQQIIDNSNVDRWASVDWENLKAQDPVEFAVRREEFREAQDKIRHAQQEQQRVAHLQQQENHRLYDEARRAESEALVAALPEWAEAEKQRVLADELRVYANSVGFQDEEINSLLDHRQILTLRKAMLYDALQNTDVKSKKVKGKPRVIRAGKGIDKTANKKRQRSAKISRLKQTGHIRDAAAAFEDLLA